MYTQMVDPLSLQVFPICMYKWFKLQQSTCNIRSSSGSVLGLIIYITHPTLFDGSMTLLLMTLWYSDQYKHLKTLPYYSLTLIASHLGLNKFLQFNADKRKYIVITRKRQTNLSLEFQPPLLTNGATIVWGRPGCIPFRLPPLQKHKKGKE